jgi:phosphoglycolate phosphatase
VGEARVARQQTIMVGDSGVDIETAHNAGVRSCGVTYGFQPETFAKWPPDILVDRLEELADQVLVS